MTHFKRSDNDRLSQTFVRLSSPLYPRTQTPPLPPLLPRAHTYPFPSRSAHFFSAVPRMHSARRGWSPLSGRTRRTGTTLCAPASATSSPACGTRSGGVRTRPCFSPPLPMRAAMWRALRCTPGQSPGLIGLHVRFLFLSPLGIVQIRSREGPDPPACGGFFPHGIVHGCF